MPALTYLTPSQEREYSKVENDNECNELLQELKRVTGENWLIEVRQFVKKRLFRKTIDIKYYTLYADCHGEYQIINTITENGGSLFNYSDRTREFVMNYMLGYLAGKQ